ncbi:alpha-1,6-mannosyl-glycoprotein 2-beta-N-acetylglucosaminyltransferase [Salarias fasciatus]|uniref:Alpha-1,6-mannosyl-glycoprotein 2-beta-N-acetylglucosaminyltransferase-like n=1 Tax=Salarias fasciatus TaxID=181472 RepID=A0A672HPG3_SALFA|nr:alpha-1,6-mannosyl-glycoprotein 2-beta-N-acetylglucosaminyltransferase-like [Salarias fasciatus]
MRIRLMKRNALALLAVFCVALTLMISTRVLIMVNRDANSHAALVSVDTLYEDSVKFQYGSLTALTRSVYSANYKQFIRNAVEFPGDPALVLVVQVHNRPQYLRLLIQSLEKVQDIQNALLIFSHDYFSKEIDTIVQGINFCKVLQIYFPFSTQLYPSEFPGQDPRDCPRDISKDEAEKTGCLNSAHPDSYGHYREAFITQTKHHWLWKLHFVWERVHALMGYTGHVILLEEDNYVLPDLIHFYNLMVQFRDNKCPDCDILSLGNHYKLNGFAALSNKVMSAGWMSTKHNMGMAISKELYYKLMGCNVEYCTFDDYNWDWTLQFLSGTCITQPLKVLAAQGSRVLHTGDCGMHVKQDCKPEEAAQRAVEEHQKAKEGFFPQTLVLTSEETPMHKPHIKNGGWGDIRDHFLCKNYAKRL